MKRNSALANLGWPFSKMDQEGTLNWSIRSFEPEEAFGSAMVSLRGDSIKAFAQARAGSGEPLFELELAWTIVDGVAKEGACAKGGKPCDFGQALEAFQSAIAMAEPPLFQPSAAAAPARPVQAVSPRKGTPL